MILSNNDNHFLISFLNQAFTLCGEQCKALLDIITRFSHSAPMRQVSITSYFTLEEIDLISPTYYFFQKASLASPIIILVTFDCKCWSISWPH